MTAQMSGQKTAVLPRLAVLLVLAALSLLAPQVSSAQQYVFNRADFATGNQPSGVAIGDLNGDGRQDMVVTNQAAGTFSILFGQSNGTFGARRDLPVAGTLTAIL